MDVTEGSKSESFSEFRTSSIDMKASAMGINDLPKEVSQLIAEELSHKMRELISTSKFIMSRNKRTTLVTDDVNKAMRLLGGCEILGHNSKGSCELFHIPGRPGEMDLFVESGPVVDAIDAALEDRTYKLPPEFHIEESWIVAESGEEDLMSSPTNSCYYRSIAKAIMKGNPEHIQVALNDLRTNPKMGPLCPFFLHLVALIAEGVDPSENAEVQKIDLSNTLVSTIQSIVLNRYVSPSPYYPVNRIVDALMKIIIETNVTPNHDDLAVRFRAGLLLAKVANEWSMELKSQIDVAKRLFQHLQDPNQPLQSHYGAIVALTALGLHITTHYFWSIIESYLRELELRASKQSNDMIKHAMAAILVAARSSYYEGPTSIELLLKLRRVDQMLYLIFGDSVTPLRMITKILDQVHHEVKPIAAPAPPTPQSRFRNLPLRSVNDCRKSSTPDGPSVTEHRKPLHRQSTDLTHQVLPALDVTRNSATKISVMGLETRPQKHIIDPPHSNNSRYLTPSRFHFCHAVYKIKFTKRLHHTSSSGDLFTML